MPTILLTEFVDIAHASGTPKATRVAEAKHRPKYDPRFDFYKPVRETVVTAHEKGLGRAAIRVVLGELKDQKKIKIYPELVTSYEKWWGRKEFSWVEPPSGCFGDRGINVVVNPELGLLISGRPHIIKLYFKAEPLSRSRVDIVTHLMELALRKTAPANAVFGIIDVRRSRLLVAGSPSRTISACLHAELAYISTLWDNV